MNIKSINSKKRYSKKAASFILTFVLIFTTVFSNYMAVNVNAAKKISLNNKKITVSVGSKKTIKVKNAPKKAKITFKTNKKKIATVTKKGVVKGVKQGKAKITVTVKYKSGKKNVSKKLTCTVTVNKKKAADKTSEQTKTDNKTDNTSEQAKDDSKTDNTSEQTKDDGGTDNSSKQTNNDAKSDDKADNGSDQGNGDGRSDSNSGQDSNNDSGKDQGEGNTDTGSDQDNNAENKDNENKEDENNDDNTGDTENEKDKVVLEEEETIRLVIGGVPNEVAARDSGDDWYVEPEVIKTYLDADVEGTVDGCASLLDVCKSKNISYEYDDVLRAAYIWDSEKYAGNYNADYYHAFEVGLAPYGEFENYDRIVTTTEFRDMLINMIKRVDPDKLEEFEENVTDYEGTLHNGEAIGMMYYASLCLNCLEYNATGYDEAPLWEDNDLAYDKLFPHYDELSENMLPDLFPGQSNHFAANIYMNCHESVYSGERPLMYDKKRQTYDQNAETTYHTIVSMTNDVYYASENLYEADWVELDDDKVTQIDSTIYNAQVKAIGDSRVDINGDDLPRSTGLFINNAPTYNEIIRMDRMSALDVRNNSNWGFNYVDYQLDYTKLFDIDVTKCNLREFEELDEFVASAVRYNIRFNISFVFIPGKYSIYDVETKKMEAEVVDYFTNPESLEKANLVYKILAERYKDVPAANLSFNPIIEMYCSKTGSYTADDAVRVIKSMFDTIRAADPDRYIVWEIVHDAENMEHVTDFINVIEDALEEQYDNYEIRGDYGELSFVYQDMNNDDYEGNNRDVNNHSMFKQGWPVTYYAVNYKFKKDEPMNFTGLLPKDTKVEIFFDNTLNCNFEAYGDDELIYTQLVTEGKHNVGSWVSVVYSFAESDYSIEFTLDKTLDKLSLTTDGEQLVISGIRLTLPEEYAVYRWWFPSWYDNGDYGEWPSKKLTSQVLICPTSLEVGSDIVINEDMLYTSDTIHVACNRESLNRYFDVYAKAAGYSSIRLESPMHTTGIMHTATMAYYSDLLSVINEHDIGWVPLGGLMELRNVHADEYPEANEGVKYHAYPALDVDLLKVFQKYQNSERP